MAQVPEMNVKVNIDMPEAAVTGVRWTMSPLYRAMNEVERYGVEHRDVRIGANKGTTLKVTACENLAEILAEITAGKRDGMGYTL